MRVPVPSDARALHATLCKPLMTDGVRNFLPTNRPSVPFAWSVLSAFECPLPVSCEAGLVMHEAAMEQLLPLFDIELRAQRAPTAALPRFLVLRIPAVDGGLLRPFASLLPTHCHDVRANVARSSDATGRCSA